MTTGYLERNSLRRSGEAGHSLMETLVVLAIIGSLIVLQAPALARALRLGKATAAGEAMHQRVIGRLSDSRSGPRRPTKEQVRSAFHQVVDAGYGYEITSVMLFAVRDDPEFRAYWHTLLDPGNPDPLEFTDSDELIAFDPEGNKFILRPVSKLTNGSARYPISWEFISTVLSETSRGDLGGYVEWSDAHVGYISFPGNPGNPYVFPMTPTVALLSHRFLELGGAV